MNINMVQFFFYGILALIIIAFIMRIFHSSSKPSIPGMVSRIPGGKRTLALIAMFIIMGVIRLILHI